MKRVVEDWKRLGWNLRLPIGYNLVQYVETSIGTNYRVAKCFLKGEDKVWKIIVSSNRILAWSAFESLTKAVNDTGAVMAYPTIEAKFDAFKPV